MKFIHLADLHIGKKLNGYSLIEDQKYIFSQIIDHSKKINPDAFLLAGDIFDRSVPSEEAIKLFDEFIIQLASIAPVYMISGNHDSGIRLSMFSEILKKSNIYIVGDYKGKVEHFTLSNENEKAKIYMLPYLTPAEVKSSHEAEANTYHEALKEVFKNINLDKSYINILISHQFYLNSTDKLEDILEGSERPIVGGLDDVSSKLIKKFDYAALGHIHGIRNVDSERIRYCGTPLKYSPNEHTKYLNCVSVNKDKITTELIELKPLKDVREISGFFNDLLDEKYKTNDYVTINLKDKKNIPNVKSSLLKNFPNLLNIKFNVHNDLSLSDNIDESLIQSNPVELLKNYFMANGQELDELEQKIASKIFKELKENS